MGKVGTQKAKEPVMLGLKDKESENMIIHSKTVQGGMGSLVNGRTRVQR